MYTKKSAAHNTTPVVEQLCSQVFLTKLFVRCKKSSVYTCGCAQKMYNAHLFYLCIPTYDFDGIPIQHFCCSRNQSSCSALKKKWLLNAPSSAFCRLFFGENVSHFFNSQLNAMRLVKAARMNEVMTHDTTCVHL